jgi:hypothetical protein
MNQLNFKFNDRESFPLQRCVKKVDSRAKLCGFLKTGYKGDFERYDDVLSVACSQALPRCHHFRGRWKFRTANSSETSINLYRDIMANIPEASNLQNIHFYALQWTFSIGNTYWAGLEELLIQYLWRQCSPVSRLHHIVQAMFLYLASWLRITNMAKCGGEVAAAALWRTGKLIYFIFEATWLDNDVDS